MDSRLRLRPSIIGVYVYVWIPFINMHTAVLKFYDDYYEKVWLWMRDSVA